MRRLCEQGCDLLRGSAVLELEGGEGAGASRVERTHRLTGSSRNSSWSRPGDALGAALPAQQRSRPVRSRVLQDAPVRRRSLRSRKSQPCNKNPLTVNASLLYISRTENAADTPDEPGSCRALPALAPGLGSHPSLPAVCGLCRGHRQPDKTAASRELRKPPSFAEYGISILSR